jgi:hypothetical protein
MVRRVKRPESRKAGWEMRVRIPPPERSLRTASRRSSSPRPITTTRRMPAGLHGCRGFDSRSAQAGSSVGRAQMSSTSGRHERLNPANAAQGLHLATMSLRGPSFAFLVAGTTDTAGECRRDYIGKGRKAERFESAPEQSGCPASSRRQHRNFSRRMPAGLQVRAPAERQEVGGSTPPPGNWIAQGKCLATPRRRHHDERRRSR